MPAHLIVEAALRRRSIQANLFPAAWAAVEPWDSFRWHAGPGERCDTFKENSSQALAIDVFGTLKVSAGRDRVLEDLAAHLGVPGDGPWEVALEWHDPDNLLAEKQPTWVDAVARGARSLIFFECKFCEPDGGACPQTRIAVMSKRKGQRACRGHYVRQPDAPDDASGALARCPLAAKGMRYWDVSPDVFGYDANSSYAPCPFAGSWFQWMRNLTTCAAVARNASLRPAFVVVYADGPGLPMAERVRRPEWQRLVSRVNPAAITFRALSFQSMVLLARAACPGEAVWADLAAWVERKIASVRGIWPGE